MVTALTAVQAFVYGERVDQVAAAQRTLEERVELVELDRLNPMHFVFDFNLFVCSLFRRAAYLQSPKKGGNSPKFTFTIDAK